MSLSFVHLFSIGVDSVFGILMAELIQLSSEKRQDNLECYAQGFKQSIILVSHLGSFWIWEYLYRIYYFIVPDLKM